MKSRGGIAAVVLAVAVAGCGSSGSSGGSSTSKASATSAAAKTPAAIAHCLTLWNAQINEAYNAITVPKGTRFAVSSDPRGRCLMVFGYPTGNPSVYIQAEGADTSVSTYITKIPTPTLAQLPAQAKTWNVVESVPGYGNSMVYRPGG